MEDKIKIEVTEKDTKSFQNYRRLPLIDTVIDNRNDIIYGMRFGVPVEKGVVLTEEKIYKSLNKIQTKLQYYTAYPDLFVDEVLVPTDSSFSLLFTQRIFLRAMMRFQGVHITAARGFSKTFISILGLFLKAIFKPGSQIAITAPSKTQATEIGKQKIKELLTRFPLLAGELAKDPSYGKDYVVLQFKNGSQMEVTAALETTRGRRYSELMCDELRDQDGDKVNSILLPTLVISRRTVGRGVLNPYEKHQSQIFTTSASSKSSYNYEKLIDLLISSIIRPKDAIVFGIDYRVPVVEGLISANYIKQMKLSPTFNEHDFAREFLSIYTSDNEESWFNFDQLNRHRKIVNAEWSAKNIKGQDSFYLLSVDVGRIHDQTVCTVFKVTKKSGVYYSKIVNIYVLGRTIHNRRFSEQARDLKKIIRAFDPIEVIIDINGLGVSMADEMIRTHTDEEGQLLLPLGFNNRDDYKEIQPANAPQILYGMKANMQLNSDMYGNCYTRIAGGLVDFVITEQAARSKLLATKKGQRMTVEQKVKHLMPYEMTTKLFEEMGNMRMKRAGAGTNLVLERINTNFPKDKFSSLIMGLWRIKELEAAEQKKKRKRRAGAPMIFYN